MKKAKLVSVINKLSGFYGIPFNRETNSPGILEILIGTKLSQNTTDKSSFKAYTNLRERFPEWKDVCEADTEEIRDCIKVCGLAKTKSENIKKMLSEMKSNYGDLDLSFLNDYEDENIYKELLKYDGIGVKTVSCVLMFAMRRDAFPVDTHVHRVLNRLGIVKTNSAEKTFEKTKDIIPKGRKYELHSNLIKFGRNICKAKNPLCGVCFLYSECGFIDKKIYSKSSAGKKTGNNNFIILENI